MAEQAVFSVLQQGGSIAVDEAKYLLGVSDKLLSAKKQLMSMQGFLKDVDKMMTRGSVIARNLVSEVRGVAYEVEDIIDCANILKRQSDPKISVRGFICKYAFFPGYLIHLHKLGGRIDSANARIQTIFEEFRRQNIASTAIAAEPWHHISEHDDAIKHFRSVHPDYSDEVDVIGFDDQIKKIKDDLLDTGTRFLSVVSIVGPGGAGKSTMAKKVYGSAEVRDHFDVRAWITVSQNFVRHDLLKDMVKRLVPHHSVEKIINDEEAAKIKEEKEVKELERLVPDLLEEVIKHVMENETAGEDVKTNKHTRIHYHHLEEQLKLAVEDWKAREEPRGEKKVKTLLQEYIKRIMEKSKRVKLEDLKEEQLENLLRNFALRGTYLMVLDDIWSIDAWDILRNSFPDKKNGSRIILTTRNESVAQYPDAKRKIYKPKLLNEQESTRLFLNKALPEYILDGISDSHTIMGQNLDELKELGKDLAAKCCGLPLAIVVLGGGGGHLSRKLDVAEWKRLTSSMDWHALVTTDRVIGSILDLSYYDMPSDLRACFLYITAFPEDYNIDVQVLAALWIAESFIPLRRGQTREELATKYVVELAQRCMVQVEKRANSGRIKVIKMHDILRDWGIGLARREGLIKDCHNSEDIDATYSEEIMKSYRVVLHGSLERKISTAMREFRTLLDFASCFKNPKVQVKKSFQSLRVLYMDCSGRVSLPREIGRMRYLRHLGLGGNCLYYLPSSIGDLLSLETMQATASIERIPGTLWQIRTLRQVHAPHARSLLVPRISSQSEVNAVVFSVADYWNQPGTGLVTQHIAEAKRIMEATKRLILKTPDISCCFGMWYGSNGMDIIGRYKGGFQIPRYVPDIEEMHKIAILKICCENLLTNDQKILVLGRMRFLKALEIGEGSYTGAVFTCMSGSFPCLQRLVLHDLAVKHWKMEHGSMTRLTEVTLCKCRSLTYLPEGLSGLPLINLDLIAMPSGLYQQSKVTRELEQKGCVIFVTSDQKHFHHLNVPYLCS